ncbi:SCO5918 family protein [Streptomyces sp. NPDC058545]|uniref:SCO5918 family protein n=1 Tax=Streptomyces sp. NPDC058545 TaxID=3346544 RepID=UPI00365A7EDE
MNRTRTNNRFSRTRTGGGYADGSGGGDRGSRFGPSAPSRSGGTSGEVITRQDRRDFSAGEVVRAMAHLGFTCRTLPKAAPARVLSPLQQASAMLGTTSSV